MKRRELLALIPAVLASGCGFQLRRHDDLPFASLYIDAPPGSAVAQRLRTLLAANRKLTLAASVDETAAVLKISREERSKTILSLSGAGRVTEYRMTLKLTYSVSGKDERVLAAPEVIELYRDMTYDDTLLLAKGAEEQLLYRDMDDNAAVRIVRRLQAIAS
jgi:LPS-assembly lipoprotein